jgi:hypothetical protein
MDVASIGEFLTASKSAVDLLKSAYEALPTGSKREEVECKVKEAEDILKRSDAKLAKDLGYCLCKCEFPPKIMLWKQDAQAEVCPSCGHTIKHARSDEPAVVRAMYF